MTQEQAIQILILAANHEIPTDGFYYELDHPEIKEVLSDPDFNWTQEPFNGKTVLDIFRSEKEEIDFEADRNLIKTFLEKKGIDLHPQKENHYKESSLPQEYIEFIETEKHKDHPLPWGKYLPIADHKKMRLNYPNFIFKEILPWKTDIPDLDKKGYYPIEYLELTDSKGCFVWFPQICAFGQYDSEHLNIYEFREFSLDEILEKKLFNAMFNGEMAAYAHFLKPYKPPFVFIEGEAKKEKEEIKEEISIDTSQHIELPPLYRTMIRSGKQWEYDEDMCEEGKMTLLYEDQIQKKIIEISEGQIQNYFSYESERLNSSNEGKKGKYLIEVWQLTDNAYFFVWFPQIGRFGQIEGEIPLAFPQNWSDILKDPIHFIDAWSDSELAWKYKLLPWEYPYIPFVE